MATRNSAIPLTVLSVPAGHPYVHALATTGDGLRRPADPTRPWWPHPALEAGYAERSGADIVHLHFGYEHRSPDELRALVEDLAAAGIPLVLTVHDLRNPHHREPQQHDAALDILIPAASAVLTLTDGAADEIHRRWRKEALVVRHPHVVPLTRGSRRAPHCGYRFGVHLKSLRANTDLTLLPAVIRAVADLPGATLRIDVHHDVLDPAHPRHDRGLVDLLATPGLDTHAHEPYTDEELFSYLEELDASILLYGFGTHSGWLETCFDVGTTAIAPDCGYLREQQPCIVYRTGDPVAVADALHRAASERPRWRADTSVRGREQQALALAHAELYAALASGRAA